MRPEKIVDFINNQYSEKEIREFIENNPKECEWWFWTYVSNRQNLSEEFLIDFLENIKPYWLKWNKNIPEDVKERIINLKKVISQ